MKMNTYIVTFYSHFGAVRFIKELKANGIVGTQMPVPRSLSASCGTCVKYSGAQDVPMNDEIEQIVLVTDTGYEAVYQADNN